MVIFVMTLIISIIPTILLSGLVITDILLIFYQGNQNERENRYGYSNAKVLV